MTCAATLAGNAREGKRFASLSTLVSSTRREAKAG